MENTFKHHFVSFKHAKLQDTSGQGYFAASLANKGVCTQTRNHLIRLDKIKLYCHCTEYRQGDRKKQSCI